MPAQYYIPGRGIGGFLALHQDWRSWTIAAGIWGGGEILAVDVSGTSVGKCTYYTEAAGDLNIVGVSAMGNEPERKYNSIPVAAAVSPENLVAAIDAARVGVRVANDNSGDITHGDLMSAEKDTQTIEERTTIATLTAVDIAAFTVLADATDVTGAELRLVLEEANKILGRANEDLAANTADAIALNVTTLLQRPEIVVPSA
ncbi:hypothetical protein KAR91_56865 [Candidatus Pacearchaeota archaeon]|nr:hypothetical protein [Candidatus Pacearchaeota archaeon]